MNFMKCFRKMDSKLQKNNFKSSLKLQIKIETVKIISIKDALNWSEFKNSAFNE